MARLDTPSPWERLRRFTSARIGLGRSGASLPTAELLRFGIAHAAARDAVHLPLDIDQLSRALGASPAGTLEVRSRATDRATYLLRPDLGRQLDAASAAQLSHFARQCASGFDLAIVIADGLSAVAVQAHAVPLIGALRPRLPNDWRIAPPVIAQQGRVALGDEIGARLGARLVLMLIGERPGLSSPDSLGAYLTWAPQPGRTDAERNCVSNIRPAGLPYDKAAARIAWLLGEGYRLRLTGVGLKDRSELLT